MGLDPSPPPLGIATVALLHVPHEKLPGVTWVSNPATRKDLVARTWGVFWY